MGHVQIMSLALPDKLKERLKKYAKETYSSQAVIIRTAINEYLIRQEVSTKRLASRNIYE